VAPTLEALEAEGAFVVRELRAPGLDGAPDVGLLVARPAAALGDLPIVVFTHGGGMVMGDHRFGVDAILPWAREFGLVVVSVDYRLAPEHAYPAAIDDAYAALRWVRDHAESIGGDPSRILLAGASSGAGLAASLALLARDRNEVPVVAQLLMKAAGAVSPYASATRAADLSGLPAAFIDVGTAETFRDEVIDYAARIAQAGGEVELHVWPGAFHAFDFWVPEARISQDAVAARRQWLRRILHAPTH
jgi:acetyl esterase/lipase